MRTVQWIKNANSIKVDETSKKIETHLIAHSNFVFTEMGVLLFTITSAVHSSFEKLRIN